MVVHGLESMTEKRRGFVSPIFLFFLWFLVFWGKTRNQGEKFWGWGGLVFILES